MPEELPNEEELARLLKSGRITREEAVEIMDQRARRRALEGLHGSAGEAAQGGPRSGAYGVAPPPSEEQPERRNDLVVEEWSAKGGRPMGGGDGREIWQYATDSVGPSRSLIVVVVGVLVACVAALGFVVWAVFRLLPD